MKLLSSILLILLTICSPLSAQTETPADTIIADSTLTDIMPSDSIRADSIQPTDSIQTDIMPSDSIQADSIQPTDSKYSKWIPTADELPKELPLFQGFTLSFDALGLGMLLVSDYGTIEGALRLGLKNTWLPIFELGYGFCDKTDYNTKINYKVNAPFFRIGCDWNFLRDKFQDNRMFVGLRWGFSTYIYDMTGPELSDPVYGGSERFDFSGTTSTSNWLEIVYGCQVKIFRSFHMGWSIRLKYHISSTKNENSKAYYIPGYGTTTNGNTWSGSYNLIFDLNWGKPKKK